MFAVPSLNLWQEKCRLVYREISVVSRNRQRLACGALNRCRVTRFSSRFDVNRRRVVRETREANVGRPLAPASALKDRRAYFTESSSDKQKYICDFSRLSARRFVVPSSRRVAQRIRRSIFDDRFLRVLRLCVCARVIKYILPIASIANRSRGRFRAAGNYFSAGHLSKRARPYLRARLNSRSLTSLSADLRSAASRRIRCTMQEEGTRARAAAVETGWQRHIARANGRWVVCVRVRSRTHSRVRTAGMLKHAPEPEAAG